MENESLIVKTIPEEYYLMTNNDTSYKEMDLHWFPTQDGFEFATTESPRASSGWKQMTFSSWDSHITQKSKFGFQTHLNCKLSVLNTELFFLLSTFAKAQNALEFFYWVFPVLLSHIRDLSRVSAFHQIANWWLPDRKGLEGLGKKGEGTETYKLVVTN